MMMIHSSYCLMRSSGAFYKHKNFNFSFETFFIVSTEYLTLTVTCMLDLIEVDVNKALKRICMTKT